MWAQGRALAPHGWMGGTWKCILLHGAVPSQGWHCQGRQRAPAAHGQEKEAVSEVSV